ncbi:MAG: ribosomal-protein-alanine N-acetyltransferase [Saprospiraceae bacterium]|jgi:ribosomal-protein-alanine N-acetyltransferase|tara:strand:- start:115 stop:627 length:513 start_codon:yes stop_codon:yes gene_type:complete
MSDFIFTTERLTIRHLTLEDLDAFYILQSNPAVMQYIKPALNYEQAKAELTKFIGYYSDPEKFYYIWAVTNPDTNQFVGVCGVYQNQQSHYEIAYRLTESAWGYGYGSEIAISLIKHSLQEIKLPRIIAYVHTENIPSVKILEKYMTFVEESVHQLTGKMGRKYEVLRFK